MTCKQAKQLAISLRQRQTGKGLGPVEYAYSVTYATVGQRNYGTDVYRICNIDYPMYGGSDQVTDWVSVGVANPTHPRVKTDW